MSQTAAAPANPRPRRRSRRSLPPSMPSSVPTPTHVPPSKGSSPSYWARQAKTPQPQPQNPQPSVAEIAHLLLATLSPVYFAIHFLKFTPEPAQEKVLRAAVPHKQLALNCNRQWGKSTIAAILIVHRLFTHPNATILIVAPAGRQSGETLRKVEDFLRILDLDFTKDGNNPHSAQLSSGSRVVALPAVDGTARGFSAVSMILFDEASRIRDRIYFAFRPMLAVSKGDLILVSTPNGRRGFFYREMTAIDAASKKWFRHTGPVTECLARIGLDFLEEEKSKGDTYYRQEWLCEFIETGRYAIDEQQLHKIIKKEVEAYKWI